MKIPSGYLTNTTTPTGRDLGAAKNNPGDNTGTGADQETFNDPVYALLATIETYKEDGNTNTDETLIASDMRDSLEQMTAKKVNGIDDWSAGTTYLSPNTLVMYKGFQFLAYNLTGNVAKDPLLNPLFWYKTPQPEVLLDMYFSGNPQDGGLSNISNRSSANYQQATLLGKFRLGVNGDTFYEFYRVALDGTVVTGDSNLESILGVGGTEYFNLDLIAPEVVGVRTLIDMSSRHIVPQSSSGDNDVLGGVLEDRFQGHVAEYNLRVNPGTFGTGQEVALEIGSPSYTWSDAIRTFLLSTDGINGTPRTGTTTRPKEFTVGSSYIIVMKAV